tara:strand:- start:1366 stop:1560 length:195 start_codon:yes stop_codon:yes gene_type:complete
MQSYVAAVTFSITAEDEAQAELLAKNLVLNARDDLGYASDPNDYAYVGESVSAEIIGLNPIDRG